MSRGPVGRCYEQAHSLGHPLRDRLGKEMVANQLAPATGAWGLHDGFKEMTQAVTFTDWRCGHNLTPSHVGPSYSWGDSKVQMASSQSQVIHVFHVTLCGTTGTWAPDR